jgi:hypothetical protein
MYSFSLIFTAIKENPEDILKFSAEYFRKKVEESKN